MPDEKPDYTGVSYDPRSDAAGFSDEDKDAVARAQDVNEERVLSEADNKMFNYPYAPTDADAVAREAAEKAGAAEGSLVGLNLEE